MNKKSIKIVQMSRLIKWTFLSPVAFDSSEHTTLSIITESARRFWQLTAGDLTSRRNNVNEIEPNILEHRCTR